MNDVFQIGDIVCADRQYDGYTATKVGIHCKVEDRSGGEILVLVLEGPGKGSRHWVKKERFIYVDKWVTVERVNLP